MRVIFPLMLIVFGILLVGFIVTNPDQPVSVTLDGHRFALSLDRAVAPFLSRLGGRTLGQIAGDTDWLAFQAVWGPVHRTLTGFNLLHYSIGARP